MAYLVTIMVPLKKILAVGLILGLLVAAWSILIEPGLLTHRSEKVQWDGPPLKIVFFSDLHAGAPHINEKYIRKLVREINSHEPDLILIGGDLAITYLLGGRPMDFEKVAEWMGDLRAKLGVYAVLGNHDWWNKPEQIQSALTRRGIRILDNQAADIQADGYKFSLVGIADDFTHHADAPAALKRAKDPKILFMHDPGAMFEVQQNYLFALAGHLHGGQIALPFWGALVATGRGLREWARGWTQLPHGPMFVSRGLGTSILPIRLNSPPEYVIIELVSGKLPL